MEESVTYQAIISRGQQQGATAEARAIVLRQGRKKIGPPTPEQENAVSAIPDLGRFERLTEKVLDVNTWDELLKDG